MKHLLPVSTSTQRISFGRKHFSFVALAIFAAIIGVAGLIIIFSKAATPPSTWYVSINGSNADGKSWTTAWNELNKINWSAVQPGDTILIDGGTSSMTYHTTLMVGKSGLSGVPITIQKATTSGHNGQAIIFGGRTTPLPYCDQATYTYQATGVSAHGIDFNGNSWIVVDGMSWHGIALYGHNNDGIEMQSTTSNDTLRNIDVYDNGDASQGSTGWEPDQKGISLQGSNHLFEQMDVHDNGQDNFQSGGMNNVTINRSWLHETREDPNNPGQPFNECTHQDGVQIYSGGTQGGLTIKNSVDGPGMKEGVILGQSPISNGSNAIVNNVTFSNVLFLNKVINVMGYPAVKETGWVLDHVTMWGIANSAMPAGMMNQHMYLEGTGNTVTNSVFYQGNFYLPDGITTASGNCQWNSNGSTSAIGGQKVDPQFMTDASGFGWTTPLATLANANYALKSTSPCAGKGSSITSVAQFLSMVTSGQSTTVPGDCNGDGHVTVTDLSILLSHYASAYTACDFNADGIVNILDLSTLLSNFGR